MIFNRIQCMLICFGVLGLRALAADTPVATAARARQEGLRTIEFEFTISDSRTPAEASKLVPDPSDGMKSGASPIQTKSSGSRLVFDGERVRYQLNSALLNLSTGKFDHQFALTCTKDRSVKKYYHPATGYTQNIGGGLLSDREHDPPCDPEYTFPLTSCCRGLNFQLCKYVSNKFTPTGKKMTISGKPCDEYTFPMGNIKAVTTAWFDPAKDHSLTRLRVDFPEGPVASETFDVFYPSVPRETYWFPERWQFQQLSRSGKTIKRKECTVDSVKIGHTYTDADFDLTFPEGMEVVDILSDAKYRAAADGSLEKLRHPQETADDNWMKRNAGWLTAASAVFVFALAVVGVVLRRRRSRTSPPGGVSQPPN